MRNFISEDDIERVILDKLGKAPFHYDILRCSPDPSKREDLNDGTMRASKRECVLPEILLRSLKKLNPDIGEEYILKPLKSCARILRQRISWISTIIFTIISGTEFK